MATTVTLRSHQESQSQVVEQAPVVQEEMEFEMEELEPEEEVTEPQPVSPDFHALTPYDEPFPEVLRGENGPSVLFFHGNISLLSSRMVAMVTRGQSTMLESCRRLAGQVAQKGYTVLVGGFRDEDQWIIGGALDHQSPVVIILHSGLATVQLPPQLEQWVQQGLVLVISAVFPKTRYTEDNAKRRHGYMVALSEYTIAVQVSAKAGSWDLCQQTLGAKKRLFLAPTSDAGNKALVGKPGVTVLGTKK